MGCIGVSPSGWICSIPTISVSASCHFSYLWMEDPFILTTGFGQRSQSADSPRSIFVYLFPMHRTVYMVLFVLVQVWTIIIHDGDMITDHFFERYINSPAHHTLHHLYFTCNYGQVSGIPPPPFHFTSASPLLSFPRSSLLLCSSDRPVFVWACADLRFSTSPGPTLTSTRTAPPSQSWIH